MLQSPALWPAGDLSPEEHEHHRQLADLRDRQRELKRSAEQLSQLLPSSAREGGWATPSTHATADLEGAEAFGLGEEAHELSRQGRAIDRLVVSLKKAAADGDMVAALMRGQPLTQAGA